MKTVKLYRRDLWGRFTPQISSRKGSMSKSGNLLYYSDLKREIDRQHYLEKNAPLILLTVMLFSLLFYSVKEYKEIGIVETEEPQISEEARVIEEEVVSIIEEEIVVEEEVIDTRVEELETFLKSFNSPVASEAESIIRISEKYGVDYKIVVSIMCAESSCAKHQGYGYNVWGWGVTDSGYIKGIQAQKWDTFENALETFCSAFSKQYAGLSIVGVSQRGYNTRQSWINSVSYFYNQI